MDVYACIYLCPVRSVKARDWLVRIAFDCFSLLKWDLSLNLEFVLPRIVDNLPHPFVFYLDVRIWTLVCMLSTFFTKPSSQPPVWLPVYKCQTVHVKSTGQFGGVGSPHLSYELWESNLDHHMYWKDLYPLNYLAFVSPYSLGWPDLLPQPPKSWSYRSVSLLLG